MHPTWRGQFVKQPHLTVDDMESILSLCTTVAMILVSLVAVAPAYAVGAAAADSAATSLQQRPQHVLIVANARSGTRFKHFTLSLSLPFYLSNNE